MSEAWQSSACILCECNCGINVQTGGEADREIVRIRGDEDHPASQGYLCQKASGLNHYQNGKDRITQPLRRREDGTYEPVSWETATTEIMQRLIALRDQHGGESIFYYGGGGQGNHLPGAYASATRAVLGSRYRSNALAQEKTGEFWVNSQMFGTYVRGDFEHCDVAFFLGKNPWHSHGIPRARALLREISKDPDRTMIVVDPVVTETAKLADIHLRVKPGRDAWLLAAMLGVIVQDGLADTAWLAEHTDGAPTVMQVFESIPIADYCAIAGVPEEQVRSAATAVANANGAAFFEDLGVQMNHHSTLVSYLEKLVWSLCGHFGNAGGQFTVAALQNLGGSGRSSRKTPVVGAPIISGLVPCNVIADEILTDHPDRYRAMLVEAANPVHSLADSQKMREALRSLDLVVVIDVAMTETAREADYVLPASTQYEKWEATFFNFENPENYFHLRKPLFAPLGDSLSEAEIHARLIEAAGLMPQDLCDELSSILEADGRDAFRDRFLQAMAEDPMVAKIAPVLLYRTLGPTLPEGAAEGAVLWPLTVSMAMQESESLGRAGYSGEPMSQADQLFDAIINGHSGVVIARDEPGQSWQRMGTEDGRIRLALPELLAVVDTLKAGPADTRDTQYPFILMAGERRDYSANTIYRDGGWRRKDAQGALRMSSADAEQLGVQQGGQVRITTAVGSAVASVEINDRMQAGHISLPNGYGLDNEDGVRTGVAANELTSLKDCDAFAATPHHKYVPARVEALAV